MDGHDTHETPANKRDRGVDGSPSVTLDRDAKSPTNTHTDGGGTNAGRFADPVEAALANALTMASAAGEWSAVAQLAKELEARRVARTSSNVVAIDARRVPR